MKLLAIMRPRDSSDIKAAAGRHAESGLRELWQPYRDGMVRAMYSPGTPGAVLVSEADRSSRLTGHSQRLRLLANGIMTLELTELDHFTTLELRFPTGSSTMSLDPPTAWRTTEGGCVR